MQEKYKQEIGHGRGNSGFFEPAAENRKRGETERAAFLEHGIE
jgi:hypothetical protein